MAEGPAMDPLYNLNTAFNRVNVVYILIEHRVQYGEAARGTRRSNGG